MTSISTEQMQRVCRFTHTEILLHALPYLNASFEVAQISTPLRAAHYLAQVIHESQGLSRFEENLNYSAEGLRAMWPGRFPSDEIAKAYEHQPEKIANLVYADRLGNGDAESGEGWRFRGRGGLQQTGQESYRRFSLETGVNVLSLPDLLADVEHAFVGAAKVWCWKGLNVLADRNDIHEITRRISGAQTGIVDRQGNFDLLCRALGVVLPSVAPAQPVARVAIIPYPPQGEEC